MLDSTRDLKILATTVAKIEAEQWEFIKESVKFSLDSMHDAGADSLDINFANELLKLLKVICRYFDNK